MSNISMVEAKLPPGFRFHPRDEELVCDYLMKKVTYCDSDTPLMIDVDLNKCEPWDIPETARVGGKEWYFYTQRDRKYATGQRTNRATASGYWKATGKDRTILRQGKMVVGMRKTLVFYQGRAPKGKKTDWVMHEFRLEPPLSDNIPKQEDWVLCRVFYKKRDENINNGKGSMGISCFDDTASSSLPELMDSNYISFDRHPPSSSAPQVPCFSNVFSPHHQTNPNPSFNHHHLPTSHGGVGISTLPNNNLGSCNSLDPFSHHDTKVLKALLAHLTNSETQQGSSSPTTFASQEALNSEAYLSHVPLPTFWNNP